MFTRMQSQLLTFLIKSILITITFLIDSYTLHSFCTTVSPSSHLRIGPLNPIPPNHQPEQLRLLYSNLYSFQASPSPKPYMAANIMPDIG